MIDINQAWFFPTFSFKRHGDQSPNNAKRIMGSFAPAYVNMNGENTSTKWTEEVEHSKLQFHDNR